jgi:TIR domain-containing protein/effector-associated domain 7 (EAD7)-containing protein
MAEKEAFSVFISYAHADNLSSDPSLRWLDRLLQFLQPLVEQNQVTAWSDSEIKSGEDWDAKIQTGLRFAKAAVLLISPAFLASKYIRNNELPVLLKNAKDRGVVILPIILRPSLFNEVRFKYPDPIAGPDELSLSSLQSANSPSRPLNSMTEFEQDQVLLSVARRLLEIDRTSNRVIGMTTEASQTVSSPTPTHPSNSQSREPDKIALREVLVKKFDVQELEELCFEIHEELASDGIDLMLSLEVVGGKTKPSQVLNLIHYLDRRGYLHYLVRAVRKNRPAAI